MKKTKQIIGILLIVLAVSALTYWETDGRNRLLTEKVVVASESIMEGDIITKQMLRVAAALPETVIDGALRPDEIDKALGKEASQGLVKNQQIAATHIREQGEAKKEKLSPFLIKAEWIDSLSSSLRKGDVISIYNGDGSFYFGDFEAVYVKDANDREITDGGVIDHLEILTVLAEYQKIRGRVDKAGEKLLIIQKGG